MRDEEIAAVIRYLKTFRVRTAEDVREVGELKRELTRIRLHQRIDAVLSVKPN